MFLLLSLTHTAALRDIFFVDVYFGGKSLRMVTFGPLGTAAGGRTAGRSAIAICINRTPPTTPRAAAGFSQNYANYKSSVVPAI